MNAADLKALLKGMSEDVKFLNKELFKGEGQLALPLPAIKESPLEVKFAKEWSTMYSGEWWKREYHFHPERKWAFDFAHVDSMVAVELEGGVWGQGRHQRAQGFMEDCDKYNAAAYLGWTVFRIATGQVTPDRLAMVQATIQRRLHERATPADPHGSVDDGSRPQAGQD